MARYKACNRAKRAVRVNSSVRTPPLVLSTNGRHPVVFSQPKDRCAGYADAGRAIVPQSGKCSPSQSESSPTGPYAAWLLRVIRVTADIKFT